MSQQILLNVERKHLGVMQMSQIARVGMVQKLTNLERLNLLAIGEATNDQITIIAGSLLKLRQLKASLVSDHL